VNIQKLVTAMIAAASKSLKKDWGKVEDLARPELKKLAQSLADIAALATARKISGPEAKSLLQIHRNTTLIVMLTVEGLGIIAAEKAVNAALRAAKDTVNAASPFKIL
jgi:hypothetical protein